MSDVVIFPRNLSVIHKSHRERDWGILEGYERVSEEEKARNPTTSSLLGLDNRVGKLSLC